MKVTQMMYSSSAVKQFTYRFNSENNTNICSYSEVLDGIPFVTIDYRNTPSELIFKHAYELGYWQRVLVETNERFLPLKDYPFPPEE